VKGVPELIVEDFLTVGTDSAFVDLVVEMLVESLSDLSGNLSLRVTNVLFSNFIKR
jgi:hypothetical protein